MNLSKRVVFALTISLASVVNGCSNDTSKTPVESEFVTLTPQQLRDPAECAKCHRDHVDEWARSMHAYAADDPVFIAMNQRAQRETNGEVGTFCVNCHAPVAVFDGATTDGSNLASLPSWQRGITCFACHATDRIDDTHNGKFHLADDGVLRGPIVDPQTRGAHGAVGSSLHDRSKADSAKLCGTCHDIVNTQGAHLARTYTEWKASLFAKEIPGIQLTCGNCHMPSHQGAASSVAGSPARETHDHTMPAVSIPITPFTGQDALRQIVQSNLDPSLVVKLCVRPFQGGPNVDVVLDNAFAGHAFPSGSAYHRRAWVELVGYQGDQQIFSSGLVDDGKAITELDDPQLWLMRDQLFDADGKPIGSIWKAASSTPNLLPSAVTNDTLDPAYYHSVTRSFDVPLTVDRLTVRVRLSPIGLEVLDDLIASGDLDPALRDVMPVWDLAASHLTWTNDLGYTCVTQ